MFKFKNQNGVTVDDGELYFYEIGAYGYEDMIEKQYYSRKNISQEKFDDTVFMVMEFLMKKIIKDEPESLCYYNIFFQPDDLILHGDFDKYMESVGFYRLSNKIQARLSFDTDNRGENHYNNRLMDVFCGLDIDESCKQQDCSRLPDVSRDDKEYCRDGCGVSIREKNRKVK